MRSDDDNQLNLYIALSRHCRYLIQGGAGVTASSLSLSPQQLVSCCNSANGCPNSAGCNGGSSIDAINYVSRVNQTTSARYPYTSATGSTGSCKSSIVATTALGQAVKLSGSAKVISPANVESTLMQAVAIAPTVIYFDAENSFQLYSGGIYTGRDCSASINHAIVAVGYQWGGSSSNSYWIVRNSWGTGWGESSCFRPFISRVKLLALLSADL